MEQGRKRVLLLVGSYKEAAFVREQIQKLRPDWAQQVLDLVPDDFDFDDSFDGGEFSLKRGQVDQLRHRGAWMLVAPLLAIERGHNILNNDKVAALGAAYFLVRIHPPPDDISFAIQSINRWAVDKHKDANWLAEYCNSTEPPLDAVGETFRRGAYRQWRDLLRLQNDLQHIAARSAHRLDLEPARDDLAGHGSASPGRTGSPRLFLRRRVRAKVCRRRQRYGIKQPIDRHARDASSLFR